MLEFLSTNHWLAARIFAGALVLLTLAVFDLRKHGRRATRWREYIFLLLVTLLAMVYGALNDQTTSLISWEYFYYGKELARELGADIPPERFAMMWAAAKVGMGATWSAGLILGVALLIANNPRKGRARVTYGALVRTLPRVLGIVVVCSIVGGLLGFYGMLTWVSADFGDMVRTNDWRPYRFMATFGVHLGAYFGGLIGIITAVVRVVRLRRRLVETVNPSEVTS